MTENQTTYLKSEKNPFNQPINLGRKQSTEMVEDRKKKQREWYNSPEGQAFKEKQRKRFQDPDFQSKVKIGKCSEKKRQHLVTIANIKSEKRSEVARQLGYGNKGRPCTDETRRKKRLASINYWVSIGRVMPFIGKNETKILDSIEQQIVHKIHRQYFIQELGYYVDGYCPETNTVYEIYEPAHKYQTGRDAKRQSEIQASLGCTFVPIWD